MDGTCLVAGHMEDARRAALRQRKQVLPQDGKDQAPDDVLALSTAARVAFHQVLVKHLGSGAHGRRKRTGNLVVALRHLGGDLGVIGGRNRRVTSKGQVDDKHVALAAARRVFGRNGCQ